MRRDQLRHDLDHHDGIHVPQAQRGLSTACLTTTSTATRATGSTLPGAAPTRAADAALTRKSRPKTTTPTAVTAACGTPPERSGKHPAPCRATSSTLNIRGLAAWMRASCPGALAAPPDTHPIHEPQRVVALPHCGWREGCWQSAGSTACIVCLRDYCKGCCCDKKLETGEPIGYSLGLTPASPALANPRRLAAHPTCPRHTPAALQPHRPPAFSRPCR